MQEPTEKPLKVVTSILNRGCIKPLIEPIGIDKAVTCKVITMITSKFGYTTSYHDNIFFLIRPV